ncbi:MAG: IS4 family transposase [Planctomycetes bacterium]|nr:IS4 family transposase [Planctomycetota bacterium]
MSEFIAPGVFAALDTGGWAWSAWMLALGAVLMAWDSTPGLTARFDSVRAALRELFPKKPLGQSYQGFIKALMKHSPALLDFLTGHLRRRLQDMAGTHWLRQGWCAFAVDGSRVECPRTRSNQDALRCAGRKKTGPQLFLTMILHMGTGLPWAFRIGPGTDSERNHLRDLQGLLPPRALLVADAGFVGYDLLGAILRGGNQFLIRVGHNVTLLRELGFARVQADNTVYLWPDKHRKKDLPPLVLRLVELHDGRKPVFLLTSVLDDTALSDQQAGVLYRMRWGVEVFYRSLKQTLARRKMHSEAPRQAWCELSWAVMGLWGLSLMSVRQIVAAGGDPLALSVATALRQVRLAIRHGPRSPKARILLGHLHAAVKDSYVRRTSKKARDWPHKKTDKPPGLPKIQIATQEQLSQAKALYVKIKAA